MNVLSTSTIACSDMLYACRSLLVTETLASGLLMDCKAEIFNFVCTTAKEILADCSIVHWNMSIRGISKRTMSLCQLMSASMATMASSVLALSLKLLKLDSLGGLLPKLNL